MSRDMSLIGLLRFFPLVQFTKARSVDTLGPFSLASLETGFVMASDCQRPAVQPCIHQNDARVGSSPCAPLRVPQELRGNRRGGDPMNPMDEPPRCTRRQKPHKDAAWPQPCPTRPRGRSPGVIRKVQ